MKKFRRYTALVLAILSVLLLFSSCGIRKATNEELAAYFYMRSYEKVTGADSVEATVKTTLYQKDSNEAGKIINTASIAIDDIGFNSMKALFKSTSVEKTNKVYSPEVTLSDYSNGYCDGKMFLCIEGGGSFASEADPYYFLEQTGLNVSLFRELSADECGTALYSVDDDGNKNITLGNFSGEAANDIRTNLAAMVPIRTKAITINSAQIDAVLTSENMLKTEKINIEFDIKFAKNNVLTYVLESESNYTWNESTDPDIPDDLDDCLEVDDVTDLDFVSSGLIKLSMLDTGKLSYKEKIKMGHSNQNASVSEDTEYAEKDNKFSYKITGSMSNGASSLSSQKYTTVYENGQYSYKVGSESPKVTTTSDEEQFYLLINKYFVPMFINDKKLVKDFENKVNSDGTKTIEITLDTAKKGAMTDFLEQFNISLDGLTLKSANMVYIFDEEGNIQKYEFSVICSYKIDSRGATYTMEYNRSLEIKE